MNIDITDDELARMVAELSAEGLVSVSVGPDDRHDAVTFADYLTDFKKSWWMYLSLIVALTETLLVESNPTSPSLAGARLILGLGLLGLVPGYSIVMLVLPRARLVFLERLILSIFLSILVSILTGVTLGAIDSFEATSNVLLLAITTFGLSIFAGYRAFRSSTAQRL